MIEYIILITILFIFGIFIFILHGGDLNIKNIGLIFLCINIAYFLAKFGS